MSTRRVILSLMALTFTASVALAQGTATGQKPFEPQVGQAGKDVVWVPTPQAVVDKMLTTISARVTAARSSPRPSAAHARSASSTTPTW